MAFIPPSNEAAMRMAALIQMIHSRLRMPKMPSRMPGGYSEMPFFMGGAPAGNGDSSFFGPAAAAAALLPTGPTPPTTSFGSGNTDFYGDTAKLIANQDKELQGVISGVEKDALEKRAAAQRALSQLVQGISQPAPEVAPQGEFAARLAGNVSQAIAPGMGGQEQAEQTIAQRKASLNQQQNARLELLAKHHGDLADQAEKAGDTAQALKLRAKEFKLGNELKLALARGDAKRDIAVEEKRASISGKDQLLGRLQFVAATSKENLDALNQEIVAELHKKNPDKRRLQNLRYQAGNESMRLNMISRSILTNQMPGQDALDKADVHEQAMLSEIADLKRHGVKDVQQALRAIDATPGDDAEWEFANIGLTKQRARLLVKRLWNAK